MGDYPDYTDLMQILGSDVMIPMDIQASYVMMPIDIQGQVTELKIDIVTQTLTELKVDIAAQTIENLNINIAAQAADVNVSITNATINVSGSVTIIGTPSVNISGTPTVNISGTPSINIASITAGVTFNIGTIYGMVTVYVSGTANIDIKTQSVGIYSQSEWAAKQGTDWNKCFGGGNKATGTFAKESYTVPAGKKLMITGLTFSIFASAAADRDKNQMGQATLQNTTTGAILVDIGGNGGGCGIMSKPIPIPANNTVEYAVYNWANHNCDLGLSVWGYLV
ncbi:hypothetical protein ES708_12635 [subsurface metagenome]